MKTVTVLMSTYNGEKYLREQIDSLIHQVSVKLSILVRDDGSSDSTCAILDEYQEKGVLHWYTGENLRSARSFLNLVQTAGDSDYYAFCDQDDVWKTDKLQRAVTALESMPKDNKPRLYCSNYQLVDASLNKLPDNGHVTTTTFNESLVSSCCTGCTVVFDYELKKLLSIGTPKVIVMHDDWAHKVCLAVGGHVIYDPEKTLYYRQHGNNVDGGVHSPVHKALGVVKRITSKDRIRSKQLLEILRIYEEYISYDNRAALSGLGKTNKNLFNRLQIIRNPNLRTNISKLDKGFIIAILFNYF